jgi:tRNA modification GTPase
MDAPLTLCWWGVFNFSFKVYMKKLLFTDDTIAAIASGITQSGIGIIRISGPEALSVADRIFMTGSGKKISSFPTHTIHHGYIYENELRVKTDEVLVSLMKAPHSYTGEDTVEINCHGGIFLMQKILKLVTENGARLAEPGEFTKRAFINGRMDLSEAEAVMDVIGSKNEFSLKNSMEQLNGKLADKIEKLRNEILHETAFIESALDDPEHFDLTGYPEELREKTEGFISEISEMIKMSQNGRIKKDGIRTVILGKPNAGKSSLLNMLSGHESAIVTDIAGTTRDTIEESVMIGNMQLNLMDTAGIRDTDDKVEKIGVDRAEKNAESADLILFVVDSSIPLDENDKRIMNLIKDKNTLIILNKSDLETVTDENEIRKISGCDIPVIMLSAKNNEGMDELENNLLTMFGDPDKKINDEVVVTNLRHIDELEQTKVSLEHVMESIDNGMEEDFFSIDLMSAYQHLGFIIGKEIDDDLVNEIFSKFCMGK